MKRVQTVFCGTNRLYPGESMQDRPHEQPSISRRVIRLLSIRYHSPNQDIQASLGLFLTSLHDSTFFSGRTPHFPAYTLKLQARLDGVVRTQAFDDTERSTLTVFILLV